MDEKRLLELAAHSIDVSQELEALENMAGDAILGFLKLNKIQDGEDLVPLKVLYMLYVEYHITSKPLSLGPFSMMLKTYLKPLEGPGEKKFYVNRLLIGNLNETHYAAAERIQEPTYHTKLIEKKTKERPEIESFEDIVEAYHKEQAEKIKAKAKAFIPDEVIQNKKDPYLGRKLTAFFKLDYYEQRSRQNRKKGKTTPK